MTGTLAGSGSLMLMACFHIHLFNDNDVIDEEGHMLPDLAAAEVEAMRTARDVIAEHVVAGRVINLDHRVEITDADGIVLKIIRFSEAVRFAS